MWSISQHFDHFSPSSSFRDRWQWKSVCSSNCYFYFPSFPSFRISFRGLSGKREKRKRKEEERKEGRRWRETSWAYFLLPSDQTVARGHHHVSHRQRREIFLRLLDSLSFSLSLSKFSFHELCYICTFLNIDGSFRVFPRLNPLLLLDYRKETTFSLSLSMILSLCYSFSLPSLIPLPLFLSKRKTHHKSQS